MIKLEYYPQVEKYVIDTFTKNGDEGGIPHLLKTVEFVKFLKPDADEALLISAIAHDIERGSNSKKPLNEIKKTGFTGEDHLKYHQEEGARITAEFLRSIGAQERLIERVYMLISKHEVGGNSDQNLLKDADSMSFFETNVEHFVTKKVHEYGYQKVKEKLDWMFNRITDDSAKVLVQDKYENAMTILHVHSKDK
ncbi:DUF4202 family protein [Candidatus Dojkabacteria bacterium]|uniref:DUF4202 family protein n=1 Tax=Candidatus Dojkabacteria bacterium TaxID=2099670 RepID=A0A955I746_9BACT|nr:DUF4202 family protein [Candidatus Dojkabacteria bacterium]